ncbi:MAG: CHASE3 domain sensor protein [Vicingaceae bacterium]|jgi:CHASE3 domain sensor protein
MNVEFFIAGGVIFVLYMGLTFWNIFDSNRKQKEQNGPNKM